MFHETVAVSGSMVPNQPIPLLLKSVKIFTPLASGAWTHKKCRICMFWTTLPPSSMGKGIAPLVEGIGYQVCKWDQTFLGTIPFAGTTSPLEVCEVDGMTKHYSKHASASVS